MEEKAKKDSVKANTGFGAFSAASGKGRMPKLSTFNLFCEPESKQASSGTAVDLYC